MNKRFWLIGIIWSVFLLLLGSYYMKMMVPSYKNYIIWNPYTIDSVWVEEGNDWHNDILLYTLLQNKVVHINRESWYFDYVSAFSDNVIADEMVEAKINSGQLETYTYLNHMLPIVHDTLFSDEAKKAISSKNPEGAPALYVDEESLISADEILIFHDDVGNLYVKGYFYE